MQFPDPLIKGTLIKRYKRFLADIELDGGDVVTAHCANTGSMIGVAEPGSEVWLSPARNPDRKLKFTWEMIRVGDGLVGINTAHPNRIVEEAVRGGKIAELRDYPDVRREVKYGKNSRIDVLLQGEDRPDCYVEVKNVHLRRETAAEFPDAVTARGAKHLREMADMVDQGARAAMMYLVQREDCDRFAVAADIDPTYAETLSEARKRGIEILCYTCRLSPEGIELNHPLPIDI